MFAAPCAPPCHKDSDELLSLLSGFFWKMYDIDFIDSIIDKLHTIEIEKLEYSRIQFIHSINVISEAISSFYSNNTPTLKIQKSDDLTYFVEVSLNSLKTDYDNLMNDFNKNFSKKQLKKINNLTFIATELDIFVNNVSINKNIKLNFKEFYKTLISKYEELNLKAINIFENYTYEQITNIEKEGLKNFQNLINFKHFNISYYNLKRTSLLAGNKSELWSKIQEKEYPDNIRLSNSNLEELKNSMIDIFTFYKYLIMDSSYSALLCQLVSIKFHAQMVEENLNRKTKKDFIEENKIFSAELIKKSNLLFNFLSPSINKIIIKENKPKNTLIVNHPHSEKTLVLYLKHMENKDNYYGVSFNYKIDFSNIPKIEDVLELEGLKTSCFYNKAHFLKEIEQKFVQEFFFEVKSDDNYCIEFEY